MPERDDASSSMDPSEEPEGPVEVPIEAALDLHPFSPAEIPEVTASYLEAAFEKGLREVRIIHGKGIGFQRQRVRSVLESHPAVERFTDAPPERGHWGSTLVWLRPKEPEASPRPTP